jgi:hypothetical protein
MGDLLFLQVDLQMLSEFGLAPRLLVLYGRLRLHAGKDGNCFVKHTTLAREIGLRSDRQVRNLLTQLRRLRLITWRRSRYISHFEVLTPDRKWISGQTGNGFPLSDRKRVSDRKEGSSSKEVLKRGPLTPTPFPEGRGAMRPSQKAVELGDKQGAATPARRQKADLDDDEAKPPPSLPPEQEFRHRLAGRHGSTFDADTCVASLKRQLDKRGISFPEFLDYDARRTTGQVNNPTGYYTALVKDLVRQRRDQIFEDWPTAVAEPVAPAVVDAHGRCANCHGSGVRPNGLFCDACQLGRDLERSVCRKQKPHTSTSKGGSA